MDVQLERSSQSLFVRIRGDVRLWNRPEAEQKLQDALRHSLESPAEQLVLNLREVTHIDSRGIGALVRVPVHCARNRISLKVILPGGGIGQALKTVRIFEGWANLSDEAAALAS